ncbi:MAG: hypothetical protein ACRC45_00605, partial [Cetobacterium sp.]
MLGKKYLMLALILGSISTASFGFTLKNPTKTEKKVVQVSKEDTEKKLYREIGLVGKLDYEVFKTALNGYNKI